MRISPWHYLWTRAGRASSSFPPFGAWSNLVHNCRRGLWFPGHRFHGSTSQWTTPGLKSCLNIALSRTVRGHTLHLSLVSGAPPQTVSGSPRDGLDITKHHPGTCMAAGQRGEKAKTLWLERGDSSLAPIKSLCTLIPALYPMFSFDGYVAGRMCFHKPSPEPIHFTITLFSSTLHH